MTPEHRPGPARATDPRSEPVLSLRDLVEAVCLGLSSARGIDTLMDRLEERK